MRQRNRINYGKRQGDWRRGSSKNLCRVRSSKALMPFFPALHVNHHPPPPPLFFKWFFMPSYFLTSTSLLQPPSLLFSSAGVFETFPRNQWSFRRSSEALRRDSERSPERKSEKVWNFGLWANGDPKRDGGIGKTGRRLPSNGVKSESRCVVGKL